MTSRVIPSHPMVKALRVVGIVTFMGGMAREIGATAMESLVWTAVGIVVLFVNGMVVEPWTEKKILAGDRMHPVLEALDKLFEVITGALGKILVLVFMTLLAPFVMIITAYRWAANARPIRWIAGNRNREWKYSKPHGQGSYIYSDGSTYTGAFKDGLFKGQGTVTYADGATHTGAWQQGKRHGQGTYTVADGRTYSGAWKDGKRHGKGTETDAFGDTYTGEWRDGEHHGQGTYRFADGRIYSGAFKVGEINGHGTETDAVGDTYTGEWKGGKRHGHGTYTFADGRTYSGAWKDGEPAP